MALEGGRRRASDADGPIRAAVPRHAAAILDRLGDGPSSYSDLDAFQADLAASQDRTAEVSRAFRGAQIAASAAALVVGLAAMFGLSASWLSGWFETHPLLRPTGEPVILPPPVARDLALWVVLIVPSIWVFWSVLTRGGLIRSLLGLALSDLRGRPAARWRCGLRSLATWVLPCALLAFADPDPPPPRPARGSAPGPASAWRRRSSRRIPCSR